MLHPVPGFRSAGVPECYIRFWGSGVPGCRSAQATGTVSEIRIVSVPSELKNVLAWPERTSSI